MKEKNAVILSKIKSGAGLKEEEACYLFEYFMGGEAEDSYIAETLLALKDKGESIEEIIGAVKTLRNKSLKLTAPQNAIDNCGTGGDLSGSLNISTAVAFVVAASGVPMAKHGNRSVSSKSGSADVLEQLGVNIDCDISIMEQALKEINICFMMAQKFHASMRHVAPVRKKLAVRTIFNLIGPLSNPANVNKQLIGVFDKNLMSMFAKVLNRLGGKKAWIVHGKDGLDEITTTDITYVTQLENGEIKEFEINPEEYGIELCSQDDLKGKGSVYNANELKKLLQGKGNKHYRNIVALNAAACLVVAGKHDQLIPALKLAYHIIDSGMANDILQKLIEITNK